MCAKSFTLTKWWLNNISKFTIPLVAAFCLTEANAQVLQTERYEITLRDNEKQFEIIPAEDHGLLLYRRLGGGKDDKLQLARLDTAFHEVWHGYLPIDKKSVLVGKKFFQKKIYLLTRYQDYTRNDLELFIIQQEDGTYSHHKIKGYIPFAPTEFQITEKAVLIGGYFNRVPIVLHFSLEISKSKVLPGLFNESGELTQIKTYSDGTFDVLISARNFKRQQTIWIKSYDSDGSLLTNQALEPEENKNLIFGRSIKTSNNMQIVAGVYGTRASEFSRGMFIASVDPSGLQQIRYYNFGDLENFFKYMKAKREQRIKSRIERRKIKGKKIKFNYRFLVHELVPYQNQYILLGEAFYPKYIPVDRSYYSGFFFAPYSRSSYVAQNGRIFDGYYYTHAVVMGFDRQGRLLWDNSFEINDVKTFTLEQFVKIDIRQDNIALLYLYDNELRTKIIKGNQVLEGKTSDPIKTKFETDIIRNDASAISKLEYWYHKYLYAYGVQDIVSPEKGNKFKRKVFFINKVTLKGTGD
ncbi:MAG: hypothetical protein ACOYXT_02325 [Bacteroidota bacterium]